MAIDTETAGAPGWWLDRLSRRLYDRRTGRGWSQLEAHQRRGRPGLDLLMSYLDGDPPLPHVAQDWVEAMRPFIRQARMNYAELACAAALERMIPQGFATAADDDRSGDAEAARVYEANQLDIRCADAFLWMLGMGDAYMIVGPPAGTTPGDGTMPLITAEDPRQVITAEDPATGRTRAAIKVFRDDWDARDLAYVYTPGRVDVAFRKGAASLTSGGHGYAFGPRNWEWDSGLSVEWPEAFRDMLPVHRLRNRRGVGEYEPHLDVLDRINDSIFMRVVLAKYQAFRQRAAIGLPDVYPDNHPKAGQQIDYSEAFLADPGAFWQMPPEVRMWESGTVDLGPVRLAIKDDVEGFCAVTRTPLYYTTPDAAAGSAEGATTQREGLIYRVEDRRRRVDPALAGVMSDAFRLLGQLDRVDPLRIRTLWQPAERHSLAERMSAAAQAKAAGLPQESIYLDVMGYGPADLERLADERGRDLLYAPLVPAIPAPQPAGTSPRTPAGP